MKELAAGIAIWDRLTRLHRLTILRRCVIFAGHSV